MLDSIALCFLGAVGIYNLVKVVTSDQKQKLKEIQHMNVGTKVIAVGVGRKTKELNGGDIVRSRARGGFSSLVAEQLVMTVTEVYGDTIRTKYYTFHKDDLHRVDDGPETEETIHLDAGNYTRDMLETKLELFS